MVETVYRLVAWLLGGVLVRCLVAIAMAFYAQDNAESLSLHLDRELLRLRLDRELREMYDASRLAGDDSVVCWGIRNQFEYESAPRRRTLNRLTPRPTGRR